MEINKKVRKSKTTQRQFELYLNELQNNPHFRENKFSAEDPQLLQNIWKSLTNKLNASGGPIKDVAGWKKTFSDWKSLVRKRARNLRSAAQETGGGGVPEKPLTDLEERLLHLTGTVVIEGIPDVSEVGLENNEDNIEPQIIPPRPITVTVPEKAEKRKRTAISTTISKFSDMKENEMGELRNINQSLQKIIEQNETIIWLKKKKMELQYNVSFADEEIEISAE